MFFNSIIIKNFSTRSGNALLTSEQRQWVDLSKFIKAQTPSQLPKGRPKLLFRAWCYDRTVNKNGFWAVGFTMIYYLHILLLMWVAKKLPITANVYLQDGRFLRESAERGAARLDLLVFDRALCRGPSCSVLWSGV